MLVVTDDGSDPSFARARRSAVELADGTGATILLYDRSAESRFVDPYASGGWTADTSLSHGDRMLDASELHLLGRDYLARQIGEAAASGVTARAWLPKGVGAAPLAEAVRRFDCDLVIVPAEMRERLTRRSGLLGPPVMDSLPVPVLVAEPDGTLHDWQFATELSRVEFTVRQFGFLAVRGHFSDFEVHLEFDEAAPERTHVEARIAAGSISTGLAIRDRDLRSASFFDVGRYPTIAFESTDVHGSGDAYRIAGWLEIKGIRRPIELDGRLEEMGEARGYRRARMHASADVNRRDWGLDGGFMVGDRATLSIHAVAVRATPGPVDVAGAGQGNPARPG